MAKQKTKETFKQLQKRWYGKLKEKGFEDIEKNEYEFKSVPNSTYKFTQKARMHSNSPDYGKQEYYLMASHFLNEHKFASKLESAVWAYHSEGLSYRNISRILSAAKVSKKSKDQISFIVKRLRQIMFELYGVTKAHSGE